MAGFVLKVLLVEDDVDVREALSTALQREGYQVCCAVHGQEAIDGLWAGQRPDLIVLDLIMPVMDGWHFRFWQKKDPALTSIPVLVLSAEADLQRTAHRQFGAAAYLQKPIDPDELVRTIKHTIGQGAHFAA